MFQEKRQRILTKFQIYVIKDLTQKATRVIDRCVPVWKTEGGEYTLDGVAVYYVPIGRPPCRLRPPPVGRWLWTRWLGAVTYFGLSGGTTAVATAGSRNT